MICFVCLCVIPTYVWFVCDVLCVIVQFVGCAVLCLLVNYHVRLHGLFLLCVLPCDCVLCLF